VRAQWKDLLYSLNRLDISGRGVLPTNQLRQLLFKFDVDMTDEQWQALAKQLDHDGDGTVSYNEFLRFFGKGTASDKKMITTIRCVTARKAKSMICQAIESKIPSGAGGLQRAFKLFDRDRSGSISFAEFKRALRDYTMLEFEPSTIDEVLREYDDDSSGDIDFRKFCERVMESSSKDSTSAVNTPTPYTTGSHAALSAYSAQHRSDAPYASPNVANMSVALMRAWDEPFEKLSRIRAP